MGTRRINWTRRKRIPRESVGIALRRDRDRLSFDADLRLGGLGLPPDSRVVVEVYRQTNWVRFDFGTVGFVRGPTSTALDEFRASEGVLFRVKVLGVGDLDGRILAEADQLRPTDSTEEETGREPLLVPRGEDLGERMWRLDLDDGVEGPQFLVNNRLGDWRGVARSPHFIWFVYPEVLRQILASALEEGVDDEDGDRWQGRWLRFAARLPGVAGVPEEGDSATDKQRWVDEIVQAFCRHHHFFERFVQIVGGGVDA